MCLRLVAFSFKIFLAFGGHIDIIVARGPAVRLWFVF